jgi:hypothetical protein
MTPRQPSRNPRTAGLSRLSRKSVRASAVALALGVVPVVALSTSAAQAASAPYCGITWGSLDKASGTLSGAASVTNVRSGRHQCYDRLVVDVAGQLKGYSVTYVNTVFTDGEGAAVPLRGGAKLQVVVMAPDHNINTGEATYRPANRSDLTDVSGFSTFRQVAWAGSFEGQSTIGLGVRARLPYRVFVLPGPGTGSRLVVDVAHKW